jgi:hypothetical protein
MLTRRERKTSESRMEMMGIWHANGVQQIKPGQRPGKMVGPLST